MDLVAKATKLEKQTILGDYTTAVYFNPYHFPRDLQFEQEKIENFQ